MTLPCALILPSVFLSTLGKIYVYRVPVNLHSANLGAHGKNEVSGSDGNRVKMDQVGPRGGNIVSLLVYKLYCHRTGFIYYHKTYFDCVFNYLLRTKLKWPRIWRQYDCSTPCLGYSQCIVIYTFNVFRVSIFLMCEEREKKLYLKEDDTYAWNHRH